MEIDYVSLTKNSDRAEGSTEQEQTTCTSRLILLYTIRKQMLGRKQQDKGYREHGATTGNFLLINKCPPVHIHN